MGKDLWYKQLIERNIDLHAFSINTTNDEITLAIKNSIHDINDETMPSQFYPLIKRTNEKTYNFLNKTD